MKLKDEEGKVAAPYIAHMMNSQLHDLFIDIYYFPDFRNIYASCILWFVSNLYYYSEFAMKLFFR